MWLPKGQAEKKDGVNGLVAVAIDKEKGSQHALKWAIDHLLTKSATVVLIHVKQTPNSSFSSSSLPPSSTPKAGNNGSGDESSLVGREPDAQNKSIFLPYRVFCTRKDIQCKDVLLEDADVSKAIIEYAGHARIEHLVLGSSTRTGLLKRFKVSDIPGAVTKGAPDFCTVYVVAKGKIQSMRSAARPAPTSQHRSNHSDSDVQFVQAVKEPERYHSYDSSYAASRRSSEGISTFRSPLPRRAYNKSYAETPSMTDTDISFVSNGRPSTERMYGGLFSSPDVVMSSSTPWSSSYNSEIDGNYSFESIPQGRRSFDVTPSEFLSFDNEAISPPSTQVADDVEAEMRRLKLELKQTMEMYNTACKEALSAQQKAVELQRWKMEEERRMEEARIAEEAALAMAEKERAKSVAAIEAAEAQKRIAELESQKRLSAEMKALREAEEKRKAVDALSTIGVRYRRYTIEEIESATDCFSDSLKIGEGGYGPVFRCLLDHTPVAVKVLRPDAAQGRSQFNREVEVLSCIRHPNMVLLLGACPEYGCLVYEHMSRGSLNDLLFRRGSSPPLPWQLRFKIAAEIGTGLLFLHQTKPEPLVHRDLKPANILLDINFVAKISDVGLARLVPPSVADNVTQYHMTSAAGTFCYIDPEYQQTGMLGVKSDVYSLGIIFLQILTAKPAMGLAHHAGRALEKGTFQDMLDPAVPDWPMEDALSLAKLAVQCAELRRRDRPDLGKVILPELNRLRELAQNNIPYGVLGNSLDVPHQRQISQEMEEGAPPSNTSIGV